MKKLWLAIFVVVLVGGATIAQAVENSVIYMPLIQSPQFISRVTYSMVMAAPAIELEAAAYTPASGDTHPVTAACHTLRAQMAAQILHGNSGNFAPFFALRLVATSVIISAGALTGTPGSTLDSPATDAALFSAINAEWSNVAGCVTVP
jgi:hypothetical protein